MQRYLGLLFGFPLLFLLFVVPPLAAQPDCEGSLSSGATHNWAYSYVEPGDEGSCRADTIPQGRKFVWAFYRRQVWFWGSQHSLIEYALSAKVNGNEVWQDSGGPGTPAEWGDKCVPDGGWLYCTDYRQFAIDVSQYTADADAEFQVVATAQRTLPPYFTYTGLEVALTVLTDMEFELSDTPEAFRPKNTDAAIDPVASNCEAACWPKFDAELRSNKQHVWYQEELDALKGRIRFELYEISSLMGLSSNFGTDAGVDYEIDGQRNIDLEPESSTADSQVFKTKEPKRLARLTISPRDYGGTAKLRVFVKGDMGAEIEAVVKLDTTTTRAFARLPKDEDGNGIADSWEKPYANALNLGDHFPQIDLDSDPGLSPTSPKGDGFALRDEYRGFHFVEDDGTTERWTGTDPTKLDVFFWDAVDASTCSSASFQANCVTGALRAHLASQMPFVTFRRVSDAQVTTQSGLPSSGALMLARTSNLSPRGFPVVFVNDATLSAACSASPPQSGALGDAQSLRNDGRAIKLDIIEFTACGQLKAYPPLEWLARTVAHETGHKFGLNHPHRLTYWFAVIPGYYSGLSVDMYATATGNTHWARYHTYQWNSSIEIADRTSLDVIQIVPWGTLSVPTSVFEIDTLQPPPTTIIPVQEQPQVDQATNIMSWTLRLNMPLTNQRFASAALEQIVVRNVP